jgi:hypothetical protein
MARLLTICLISLCMAVGLAPATAGASTASNKAALRTAARAYFSAQAHQQWRKACLMLSKHALAQQGGLKGCIDNFSTNGFSVGTMTITSVTVRPSGYRGVVNTYLDNNRESRWNLHFVRERGVYKLDSD